MTMPRSYLPWSYLQGSHLSGKAGLPLALTVLLTACSGWPVGTEHERIVERATGRVISCAELARQVQDSDVALLGEQHDQAAHHQRRGALLARLRPPAAVVAEQLPRGAAVVPSGHLLASLQSAGFRAEAWDWPLHEPLFASVLSAGLPLTGGNLRDDELRAVLKQGAQALPGPMAAWVADMPLSAAAQAALDADLMAGHGGHVPAARLQAMRQAQRGRDASMRWALQASGGQPAVLVAGNGHVRLDYGVPQLLQAVQPAVRVVSVGLATIGQTEGWDAHRYTHVWLIDAAQPARACDDVVAR